MPIKLDKMRAEQRRVADQRIRRARCGACGTEQAVTEFMRRHERSQFKAQPTEPLDSFYCGCQDDDDDVPF